MTDSEVETVKTPGSPLHFEDKALGHGASFIQDFTPIKQVCAHLNAFHVYVSDSSRHVETNHYCAHLTSKVRQCILYDGSGPDARLIGIEYMITPDLFATLDPEEKRRWHTHTFEVKSGMLVMPGPTTVGAQRAWEAAETREMGKAITLYGKVYHLWQTDRGDALPVGEPQLMSSFTSRDQFDFEKHVGERDKRYGTDYKRKEELRSGIPEPETDPEADAMWRDHAKDWSEKRSR